MQMLVRFVIVFGLPILAFAALALVKWRYESQQTVPLLSFDELAAEHARGWKLVTKPALPGPFRYRGAFVTGIGGGGGTGSHNQVSRVSHRFTPKPGIAQLAVKLETEAGMLTLALFER